MKLANWLSNLVNPRRTKRVGKGPTTPAEQLEQRTLLAATYNVVFDGSFEDTFHFFGYTANQVPDIPNQTWHDANPFSFKDPDSDAFDAVIPGDGPNSGWYLQPTADPSGGSVDVVGTAEGFGALLAADINGNPASYSAQDGNNAIDLIGTPYAGAFNQIVETVPGVTYELSFYLSSNQENGHELDQNGRLSVNSDRKVQLWWNGTLIDPSISAANMGTWDQHTYSLTATGTTSQLGFYALTTPNSLAREAGITPVVEIPHNAGDPLFGPLLDNVSLTAVVDANDDSTTVLSEDDVFSSFNRNVMANDIGGVEISAASVIGRTTNTLASIPAGTIFATNSPAPGNVFWDLPGPDPMSAITNSMSAGEYFEDIISYDIRSVRTWDQTSLGLTAKPFGVADTATWRVRVEGRNDNVTDLNAMVDNIFEDQTATLQVSFVDPDLADTHVASINWGDGSTQTIALNGARTFTATHQYLDDDPTATTADQYPISITIADNHGSSASTSVNTTVTNVSPAVDINLDSTSIDEDGFVSIQGTFTDPGTLDTHTVVLNWGDGTSTQLPVLPTGDRTFVASHQYLDDDPTGTPLDSYTVTATVEDDDTGIGTDTATLLVSNVAPVITSLNAPVIDENGTATISGTFTDIGSLDTHTVVVDWGDGTTAIATVDQANGTFTASKQFLDDDPTATQTDVLTATVTVTDDDTGTASQTTTVTVNNVAPVITSLNAPVIDENGTATISGTFTDIGSLDTHTVVVDWGDGTTANATVDQANGTFTASKQFLDDDPTATQTDVLTATVTVTDDDTGTAAQTTTVTVNNVAPVITSLNAPVIDENGTAIISGTFTDIGSLDTHTVVVDWGDGTTANATVDQANGTFTASKQFLDDDPTATQTDVLTATVTVTDDDTGTAAQTTTVTVNNVAPVITSLNAPVIDENGTAIISGTFTDIGSLDTHTVVVDWGDGTTANATVDQANGTFTASKQFLDDDPTATQTDVLTATVTVTDDDTGTASQTTTVTVNNVAPVITSLNAPVIDENGTATISGTFTDIGSLDTHTVVVDWGDGTTAIATVDQANGTFTASKQFLDDDPTATPIDVLTATVTVTDDDTGTASQTTTVTVNNVAPVITSLNAPVIDENGTATISGTFTDIGSLDTHTVVVDWGDGTTAIATVDQANGTFTASKQFLDDDPTATPIDVLTATVTVTDDDTGTASQTTTVTVNNVAPVITSFTSTAPSLDQCGSGPVAISGSIVDVGTLDTHEAIVDWGDGTSETISVDTASRTFASTHSYASTGTFTITVTAIDDDTGVSLSETTTVIVAGSGLADGTLFILGTNGRDHITIKQKGRRPILDVDAKLDQGGNMTRVRDSYHVSLVDRIVIVACDGHDHVNVHHGVHTPTTILGGKGRDHLDGGSGHDVIVGGKGRDKIFGRDGDDILIGGKGKDDIQGGCGDDLLIGGYTNKDFDTPTALEDLEAASQAWVSGDLTSALAELGTIVDDGVKDKLFGGFGQDELFGGIGDFPAAVGPIFNSRYFDPVSHLMCGRVSFYRVGPEADNRNYKRRSVLVTCSNHPIDRP